ncbi:hypothetical protein C5689_06360 [Methylosinus sporium]|uniref:Uncharacterized protein n=1 Tax=Methylosinus sporium TaxID=428 RepID=A0A2U1SSY5_METSR|nr:hypothetical protein C5689_06360 [Methylosinus sporium]
MAKLVLLALANEADASGLVGRSRALIGRLTVVTELPRGDVLSALERLQDVSAIVDQPNGFQLKFGEAA